MRRILLTLLVLAGLTLPTAAQESEDCDPAGLLITIMEAAGAATDADVWAILDGISARIAHMKAACSGLVFEGTQQEVIGPVTIPEGIYRVRGTAAGTLFVDVVPLEGECGEGTGSFLQESVLNGMAGQAVDGIETVFTSLGCEALIEIELLSDPAYTLTFEKIR